MINIQSLYSMEILRNSIERSHSNEYVNKQCTCAQLKMMLKSICYKHSSSRELEINQDNILSIYIVVIFKIIVYLSCSTKLWEMKRIFNASSAHIYFCCDPFVCADKYVQLLELNLSVRDTFKLKINISLTEKAFIDFQWGCFRGANSH